MSQQDRYGYGYGYGDYGRAYYRGRRRPRSPFGDIKLAALGKMYADVPVDAVTKAMEGLNTNYKENRDMLDKYKSALAQAKVMAGDEPEKQRIIKDIQSRVDSFIEDTGGAFETGDDFIRGVANDVISNPWLAQSITNKEKFDEDQKMLDQMRMQGLAPLYLADENFTTMGPEGQNRQYTSYIGSEVNRRTAIEPFFKNLKANKSVTYNNMLDVFTTQGVSQDRIDQVVAGALPLLQETKEYRQSLENEKARAANQGIPFNEEAFNKGWLNQLEQVGREFVYNQNDMNLNRSATRGTTNGGLGGGGGDPWESFGNQMIGAKEGDAWMIGDSSGTDDVFKYYSDNTKYDQDTSENEPRMQKLLGNVIDLTDAKGKFFSSGKFYDSPGNQTYNARSTGNMYSIPIAVDFSKNTGYGTNSGEIAKAFKDKLNLTWNASDQEGYANQLPHVGRTGGIASPFGSMGADNTWTRNYKNMEPKSLQVGNYSIRYLEPKDPGDSPIVVEMRPKREYEVFDTEGASKGTVLADMSPERANEYRMQQDIGWSSYSMDGSMVNIGSTNTRLNETAGKLRKVNPDAVIGGYTVAKWLGLITGIQQNMKTKGVMGDGAVGMLDRLDRVVMPVILNATNMFPDRDMKLSKSKTR